MPRFSGFTLPYRVFSGVTQPLSHPFSALPRCLCPFFTLAKWFFAGLLRGTGFGATKDRMTSSAKAAPIEGEHPIAMASVDSTQGYRGDVRVGKHRFVADEGPEVGGDDEGPNPYQLLLAGLVQCTAATLRMYANRKGWVLGEVKVRARLLRTGDGADKTERIERTISVGGDLTAEQKQRLAEIADRTPVTRTLQNGLTIDTTLT